MFYNPNRKREPSEAVGPPGAGAQAPPPPDAPRARRSRRWLVRVLATVALVLVAWHAWVFVQVWRLRNHDPRTTAFMERGLERLRKSQPSARLQFHWAPYGAISENLKRAVIAAEDQRFLEHSGFDFKAIGAALDRNGREGGPRHGGSTISQQLAKNLFLSPHRSYLRKAQEAVITVMLESALSKRRILEIYLNVTEWGGGIYGAEAAARHYFDEAAADLNPKEAARLAAILPSPRRYTDDLHTSYIDDRMEFLLGEMERARIP